MAGARRLSVDPDDLHRLAGALDDVADRLVGAARQFGSSSQPHRDAFGLLPPARAAHATYAARAQDGLDALHSVHGAFHHSLASGLRTTAVNYMRADLDSAAG
jgi:excreted virulence factor EspC (type VII ESX diderm)